jgi:uncharacterized protein (TIGR02145 family)
MKKKNLLMTAMAIFGLAAATFGQTIPSYVPTNGLVGWWPFTGNALDESANANDGTVNGATLVTDRFSNANSAYSFDGINDDIICPNSNIPTTTNVSISVWIKPFQNNGIAEFICLGSPSSTTWGTMAGTDWNGSPYQTMNYGRGCSGTGVSNVAVAPNLNNWQHITYVSSGVGGICSVYVNGNLIGQSNNGSVGSCTSSNLYFGVDIFGPNYINCVLDDIGIWDRALTQQEITALYNSNNCNNITASATPAQPTCGLPNATLSGSASGGSGSYNYLWSNGATTASVSNLSAGTYTLTVTDNNGCTASSSANVNNSICPKINTQSTINNITQNSATVSWPAVSCAAKYRVIIKNVSTAVQTTTIVASPATSLNLINLQPNTTYQVRIRTQCSQNGTVLSQTSPITSFTTLNSQGIQCLPPTNISSALIGASSVQVSWTAAAGVIQYNLRYRIVGTGTWITNTINASLTDITLINLTPASTYEFQMRTKCNNNPSEFSPYSTLYNFYSGSSGTALHSCGPDSVHNSQLSYGLLTDQQGNNYKTILIGSQEWMAENLYSSIYRNGDPINNITGNTQWQNATSGAWCHFNNNSQFECPYGKLYNWYAVADSRNLCPTGWHIPTDTEWNILIQHLDSMYSPNATASQSDSAGGKIKTSGFAFWSPSTDTSSNSSGFSGLPAGNRSSIGVFSNLYAYANWWSASVNVDNSWYRSVRYFNNDIYRFSSNRSSGFSVRCLKDQSSGNRIHHNESLQRFNLYPNPTKHSINLIINSPTETTATITISDILGRVLQTETEELINGTNTITYNISAFAAGVYLVHVGNGNTQQVFKLVKE